MRSAPRILLVIPGLLAGLLVPAVIAAPRRAPTDTVGMISDNFAQSSVTIQRGERLTLFNSSDAVHVIGPGRNGHIIGTSPHVPVTGFHLMQTNTVFTTGRWETPGTYYLTCSVHPHMTLKVVVVP